MATINEARIGCPLYCRCGTAMVQRRRENGVATVECFNPKCERVGKVYLAPMLQLEEITVEAAHV